MNETFVKSVIYVITALMVFTFLFFWRDAAAFHALEPDSASSEAALQMGGIPSSAAGATAASQGLAASVPGSLDLGPDASLENEENATSAQDGVAPSASYEQDASSPLESSSQSNASSVSTSEEAEGSLSDESGEDESEEKRLPDPMPDLQLITDEWARLGGMGFAPPEVATLQFMGDFLATAYCCEVYPHICGGNGVTASGTVPTPGLTCAAYWPQLPPGTWLYIEGVGIRRVEDSGSAITNNRLDIAIDTHDNALYWPGYGWHRVWVLSWG